MVIYEASAHIRASRNDVWGVLADVEAWPGWLPTVSAVHGLDGPCVRTDARFEVAQPRLPPAVWQVTMSDPASGFTWEARSPGTRIVAEHLLAGQPDGSTMLVLRLSFHGVMGRLFGRLSRSTSERNLALEAEALKNVLERATAAA